MFFIQTYLKRRKCNRFVKSVEALKITDNMNFENLGDFYNNLYSLINDYQTILKDLPTELSKKQKTQVQTHLTNLIIAYVDIIKELNTTLSTIIKNKDLSISVRQATSDFAEKSIAISETTLNLMSKLATLI